MSGLRLIPALLFFLSSVVLFLLFPLPSNAQEIESVPTFSLPDVRCKLSGNVLPHCFDSNPANLIFEEKYDVSASFGWFENQKKATRFQVTDSATSRLKGAIGFVCLSDKIFCSSPQVFYLPVALSYPFKISNIDIAPGVGYVHIWSPAKLVERAVLFGLASAIFIKDVKLNVALASHWWTKSNSVNISGGFSLLWSLVNIFADAKLRQRKMELTAGLSSTFLDWFKVNFGWSSKFGFIGGLRFISPRLHTGFLVSVKQKPNIFFTLGIKVL